jgi:hypothetical protein
VDILNKEWRITKGNHRVRNSAWGYKLLTIEEEEEEEEEK